MNDQVEAFVSEGPASRRVLELLEDSREDYTVVELPARKHPYIYVEERIVRGVEAIRDALLLREVSYRFDTFSDRWLEMLGWAAIGKTKSGIASTMGISTRAVRKMTRKVMARSGAVNRRHAASLAIQCGVLKLELPDITAG